MAGESFAVSIFTAEKPRRLSKAFRLMEGRLVKEQGGALVQGEVRRTVFQNITAFTDWLKTAKPNQAVSYGVPQHDFAKVVTEEMEVKAKQTDVPIIARTRNNFSFASAPSILMLDYDPRAGEKPLSSGDLLEHLYRICPEIEAAPHAVRPSASSFIYSGSELLKGPSGLRVFIVVQNGRDIPRIGGILFKRSWLHGHGYIRISRAGRLLVRSIIDDCVWQPERLDFIGGAECEVPLVQRLPAAVVHNADNSALDTSRIENLSLAEEKRFADAVLSAKLAMQDEAHKVAKAWRESIVEKRLERENTPDADRKARREHLHRVFRQAMEGQTLLGDFELTLSDGKRITVAEVLDAPDKWHGKRICDPLEPEEYQHKPIAWLNLRAAGRPYLFSHAHAGVRYNLHRARREIQISPGERRRTVEKCLELIRVDGSIFERGGELVRVAGDGSVVPMNRDGLALHLDGVAKFAKFDARSEEFKPCDCPESLPKGLLAMRGDWRLPTLKAVVTAPTLDPKTGRVLERDGYDPETGLLLACRDTRQWPGVPAKPSIEDAREAIRELWLPFQDFPFTTPVDRGVMVAAILTAAIRPALETAPGTIFTAPTAASGKTLLANCLSLIAGQDPAIVPVSDSEEEMRKRLISLGRIGTAAIVLDNLTGVFSSAVVEGWLTATSVTDRLLGVMDPVTVPTRALMLMTGNNVMLRGDLCRRILNCRIDPGMETPWKRTFSLDPRAYCAEHRLPMVAAALTLLRAAMTHGDAPADRTASFEAWSDTVRRAVLFVAKHALLDVADPCLSIDSAYEHDPETSRLRALLVAWHNIFGKTPVKAAEVKQKTMEVPELQTAVEEVASRNGKIIPQILGIWLDRNKGRIVDGYVLKESGKYQGTKLWMVEKLVGPVGLVGLSTTKEQNCHFDTLGYEYSKAPRTPQAPRDIMSNPESFTNPQNASRETAAAHVVVGSGTDEVPF